MNDPTMPAYVVGGVTFLLWMLNSKKNPDEGIGGLVIRLLIAAAVGALVGAGAFFVLGGEIQDR